MSAAPKPIHRLARGEAGPDPEQLHVRYLPDEIVGMGYFLDELGLAGDSTLAPRTSIADGSTSLSARRRG